MFVQKYAMNKDFLPYPLALRMKNIGFDNVPCLALYYNVPEGVDYDFFDFENGHFSHDHYETHYYANKGYKNAVLCPTFSQAFRWFRENYGDYLRYSFGVVPHFNIILNLIIEDSTITYEEAELACLDKLIDIVEQKQKENEQN